MPMSNEPSQPLSIAGTKGSPLRLTDAERAAYAQIAKRPRKHLQTIDIAARTGKAFVVEQGQILPGPATEGRKSAISTALERMTRAKKSCPTEPGISGAPPLPSGIS